MTQALLDQQLDKSIEAFCVAPGVTPELAENLVSQGFFSFDDLSVIEPDQLVEMSGLSAADCDRIIEYADVESARLEVEERIAAEQRKHATNQVSTSALKKPLVQLEIESVAAGGDAGDESAAAKEMDDADVVIEDSLVSQPDLTAPQEGSVSSGAGDDLPAGVEEI